ncbi:hypothetical protein ACIPD2_18230 [Streptomyces griseofuscus]|uniref:hypothetical protein n=1 Tax=Streptomyces griseofuscus TaxID=146922 RepID=UPI0038160C5A
MTTPERGVRAETALDIATQWASLPADHLRIALEHLAPQLKAEHEHRMLRDRAEIAREKQKAQAETALAELRVKEEADVRRAEIAAEAEKDLRAHRLYLIGLVAGFVLAAGMLTGAILVGLHGEPWLAGVLAGPSLVALPVVFVLRRTDPVLNRAIGRPEQPLPRGDRIGPPGGGATG